MRSPVSEIQFRWYDAPAQVDEVLSALLAACWAEVSNAGGAVGFPFIPVDHAQVVIAVQQLVESLDPAARALLVAISEDVLIGWLVLERNPNKVVAHWARVLRLQTTLASRGAGVGRALLLEVARSARDDFGLEQLHIEVRGGQGLETFYEHCGWLEVGRWPGALRLGLEQDDDRDEVLMVLTLKGGNAVVDEPDRRIA